MTIAKLSIPAFLIATLAIFATCAHAQTGAEYGAATAGVATDTAGMGASIPNESPNFDISGSSSQTWGASALGASFDSRASAMSGSGGSATSFSARASAMNGGESGESRWPQTALTEQAKSGENRFPANSDRFASTESRFGQSREFNTRAGENQANRFPASAFHGNQGLDTNYNRNP